MKSDILYKLEFIISECKRKDKLESITTASAGVPGDGPIADVQNGLAITKKDKEAIKKNKELLNSFMFRRISEGSNITNQEILDMLDIPSIIKKYKNDFNLVWKDVNTKIIALKNQLRINITNSDINLLKAEVKKMV